MRVNVCVSVREIVECVCVICVCVCVNHLNYFIFGSNFFFFSNHIKMDVSQIKTFECEARDGNDGDNERKNSMITR